MSLPSTVVTMLEVKNDVERSLSALLGDPVVNE